MNISEEQDNTEPDVIEQNQVEEECIDDESIKKIRVMTMKHVIDFKESKREELDPGNKL